MTTVVAPSCYDAPFRSVSMPYCLVLRLVFTYHIREWWLGRCAMMALLLRLTCLVTSDTMSCRNRKGGIFSSLSLSFGRLMIASSISRVADIYGESNARMHAVMHHRNEQDTRVKTNQNCRFSLGKAIMRMHRHMTVVAATVAATAPIGQRRQIQPNPPRGKDVGKSE